MPILEARGSRHPVRRAGPRAPLPGNVKVREHLDKGAGEEYNVGESVDGLLHRYEETPSSNVRGSAREQVLSALKSRWCEHRTT